MDLKEEVEKNIESIFSQADSIVKSGTYRALTGTTRDDNYKSSQIYASTPITCLVVSFKRAEIIFAGGKIAAEDKKILIPLKDLSVTFKVGNLISIGTDTYNIKDVSIDPTESLATVQGRK